MISEAPAALSRATPADAQGLANLARRSYEVYLPIIHAIPAPISADYGALARNHEVWILRSGAAIAASLVLIRREDHLLIESIAVDPDHQGKGYGRQLLEWAGERAEASGLSELRLYTNVLMTNNRDWYRRAGYLEMHEEQRGDKRIVHMRRQLAQSPSHSGRTPT